VAAAAHHNGAVLTMPVMGDGAIEPAGPPAAETGSAPFSALPRQEAVRPERVPAVAADAAESPAFRPAHADAAAKTFDVATTRRRPVVFEEDDDLDVPDFLK
jgi:cell division protein FtsZ